MGTVSSTISLVDRVTPTFSKIERQAIRNIETFNEMSKSVDNVKKALAQAEKINPKIVSSQAYMNASKGLEQMENKLYDVANGNAKFGKTVDTNSAKLKSLIATTISWAGVAKGVSSLMNMSDSLSATTARINLMNDGFQTTAQLQNYIFQTAQKTGTSYTSMQEMVAKLGTQAGNAFGNNSKQIVDFATLLNKTFQLAGMESTAIQSTMYNLTQSLASGKLLGNDYRIIKQNAPQIVQYLKQFYGVSQSELDAMVRAGKVSASDLKNAMFQASAEIEQKYSQLPMTFSKAWTKFTNTLSKLLEPIAHVLSSVADGLDKVFTFLAQNQYILYIIAGVIGIIGGALLIYSTYTTIATIVQNLFNSALGRTALIAGTVIVVIGLMVAALLYLWNNNDQAAEAMLVAWDGVQIGMQIVALGIKTAWYGLQTAIEGICVSILSIIELMVNGAIGLVNTLIKGLNMIPGVNIKEIEKATFAEKAATTMNERMKNRAKDLNDSATAIQNKASELNATRAYRVQNRKKIGFGDLANDIGNSINTATENATQNALKDVTGNDSTGGKAVKTTTDDKLISDEDIQLLLDVATRDYKLNYQQVTPNITLTFGDVRETADVDNILDQVADRLEEIYDGNLGVT